MTIIKIREYQNLTLGETTPELKDYCACVSEKDFKFLSDLEKTANPLLMQYYTENTDNKKPPEIIRWINSNTLRIQNYVGMVQLPSGGVLEILPKIQITKNPDKEKSKLTDMIISTLTPRVFETTGLQGKNLPLMEYIIWYFLKSVDDVLKKGIKQNYQLIQENSSFIKGKILFNQHILYNSALKHRTYIEYEDYTPNCIENRALHSALWQCVKHSTSDINKQNAIRYCHMFDSIDKMHPTDDLNQWKDNRYYQHYNNIRPLVKIILSMFQPFMAQGKHQIPAVLFPMEIVYEKYIAYCLQQHCTDYKVHPQHSKKHLAKNNTFNLQPDIFLQHDNKEKNIILDTKWKRYKDDDGINQGDVYQMFAYSQAYTADTILLYPKNHKDKNHNDTDKKSFKTTHQFNHGNFNHGNKKYLYTYLTDLSEGPNEIAYNIQGAMGGGR